MTHLRDLCIWHIQQTSSGPSLTSPTLCSVNCRCPTSFTGVLGLSACPRAVTRLFNLIGGCYIQTHIAFCV
ncbi:uncharacterized protein LOC142767354 isoform X2 [Rhipicephalus microplus]|uniref:uncharacterized protein LOC142767354 isoform X2 n=1 Tax=Rhipicephalus microplus TaxID=6941 RepID=UPI003F6CE337